ncbi:MAG: hypothetical protein ACFB12_16165 [Leptolyngbyaceae cyanobacterium]
MLHAPKSFRLLGQRAIAALLISILGITLGFAAPAYSDTLADTPKYIAADGRDLTAVAECLPKRLSQPNLKRALSESQNDFLEKVFDMKDDYDSYKLDETEIAYLACLEEKGVTPQVKR